MPTATAYGSIGRALRAAQRLANRTGKQVRVLVANPGHVARVKQLASVQKRLVRMRQTPRVEARLREIQRALSRAWSPATHVPPTPGTRSGGAAWWEKRARNPIEPTEHAKLEWARMAQAAYKARLNAVGHRFSGFAALPRGAELPTGVYDTLQQQYREWLIGGRFPQLENPRRGSKRTRYPHALAAKYIRQEFRAGRKGKQHDILPSPRSRPVPALARARCP